MTTPRLPQTTVTYYLQPNGTYADTSTGVTGESPILIPVVDAVCLDDLDQNGNETTSDLQVLAQDVYHLLLEAPGSNLDDPTRGVGLDGLLSKPAPDLVAAANTIDAQLRKDKRIGASKTTLTANPDGSYTVSVAIVVNGSLLPLGYLYSSAAGLVKA